MSDQEETTRQGEQQEIEEEVIVEIEENVTEEETDQRTCWGCRNGILNQLGHVDIGGCLYFEPYEDDEIIETMSVAETVDETK